MADNATSMPDVIPPARIGRRAKNRLPTAPIQRMSNAAGAFERREEHVAGCRTVHWLKFGTVTVRNRRKSSAVSEPMHYLFFDRLYVFFASSEKQVDR
jgi:hypothetical protein